MRLTKYHLFAFLFFISLASSVILVYQDFKPTSFICNTGEGCDLVKNSEYNTLFFGIPNEYVGLVFFASLLAIVFSHIRKPNKNKDKIITLGILGSFIFALYSLYIMEFVIGAYCKYCFTMDISIILSFIALIFFDRKKTITKFSK